MQDASNFSAASIMDPNSGGISCCAPMERVGERMWTREGDGSMNVPSMTSQSQDHLSDKWSKDTRPPHKLIQASIRLPDSSWREFCVMTKPKSRWHHCFRVSLQQWDRETGNTKHKKPARKAAMHELRQWRERTGWRGYADLQGQCRHLHPRRRSPPHINGSTHRSYNGGLCTRVEQERVLCVTLGSPLDKRGPET